MTVVALAGRRVDGPNAAVARFPVANVALVRDRVARKFAELRVNTLVASAAAGADLLALRLMENGVGRIAILPFEGARFEASSVADRPGSWVDDFRSVLATARVEIVGGDFADDDAAFAATTEQILRRAVEPGGPDGTVGVVVWEGEQRRDSIDHTAMFARRARELGIRVEEVSTLV